MTLFAIRGVDGQVGIVSARHTRDAVERLGEFANFEGCPVRRIPELMLLLDISDDGELVLVQIGDEAATAIRAFAYPIVEKVLSDESPPDTEQLRRAVEAERRRVKRKETKPLLTSRGGEIQRPWIFPRLSCAGTRNVWRGPPWHERRCPIPRSGTDSSVLALDEIRVHQCPQFFLTKSQRRVHFLPNENR